MHAPIAGREAELASVRALVASVSDGMAAVVLRGAAGIGKTTIWEAGAAGAEGLGHRVLRARPGEGETALGFSGVRDLLERVLEEALDPLPAPQRRALSHALMLEEDGDPPPDRHAIGVALLGAIRVLAEPAPLLIAIDDVHWLDEESTAVLAYAARRLREERVALLLAARESLSSPLVDELARSLPASRFAKVTVEALDMTSLHEAIQAHLGVALAPPLLAEVHETSGGNPFYALEIVRLLRRSGGFVPLGLPLPVPESLHGLVHARLLALPAETRDQLLVAAALSSATVALVAAASGAPLDLAPAVDAGVVEISGERIRFTHPLLAAGAYELAAPVRRAAVHARLAELVDDLEARGRHLAVAVTEPNGEVASTLEAAAGKALARGAPRTAALLLERAQVLTPEQEVGAARRRALAAASAHHESGDTVRARALLEAERDRLSPGPERARVLVQLARVRSYDDDLREASALFEQAAAEAEPGSAMKAYAREGRSSTLFRLREGLAESVELSRLAVEAASVHGDEQLLAEALATKALAEAALGRPESAATADEALALQTACADRPILRQPRFSVAVVRFWHDDLEGARREYEELAGIAAELGDESSIPYVRVMQAQIDCALGRFDDALRQAQAGQAVAEQAGQRTLLGYLLAVRTVAEAHLGRVEDATSSGVRALELAEATSGVPAWIFASWGLGHLALALGDPNGALARLEPLDAHHRREAIEEPGALPFLPDCVEALVAASRLDDAAEALAGYEAAATRLERKRGTAAATRCRGLLAGAAGELETAVEQLTAAVELARRHGTLFDEARALLALGVARRRSKRRREARATLTAALAAFEQLGAALWAERTRAEQHRISGRAASAGALTPAEQRVAALVVEGRTNREVAAALFLSDRTVEGHLSRVFSKLGVRSRTELVHALASSRDEGVAGSNTGGSPVSGEPAAP